MNNDGIPVVTVGESQRFFLQLNPRPWYEVKEDDVTFLLNEDGHVWKMLASCVLEIDDAEGKKIVEFQHQKQTEELDRFVEILKQKRKDALEKFRMKDLILSVGGEELLGVHNYLAVIFGKPDRIL